MTVKRALEVLRRDRLVRQLRPRKKLILLEEGPLHRLLRFMSHYGHVRMPRRGIYRPDLVVLLAPPTDVALDRVLDRVADTHPLAVVGRDVARVELERYKMRAPLQLDAVDVPYVAFGQDPPTDEVVQELIGH
jgi:hypothetical protein